MTDGNKKLATRTGFIRSIYVSIGDENNPYYHIFVTHDSESDLDFYVKITSYDWLEAFDELVGDFKLALKMKVRFTAPDKNDDKYDGFDYLYAVDDYELIFDENADFENCEIKEAY
jgi:hypothetical protein